MDDEKLKCCKVILFKLPISPSKNEKFDCGIKGGRLSARIKDNHKAKCMKKTTPNMTTPKKTTPKKTTPKKTTPKKIQNKGQANDRVEKPVELSVVAANVEPNISSELDISDDAIVGMFGELSMYIQDGVGDPTSALFDLLNISGMVALPSQSDEITEPTTHPVAIVSSDSSALQPQLIFSQDGFSLPTSEFELQPQPIWPQFVGEQTSVGTTQSESSVLQPYPISSDDETSEPTTSFVANTEHVYSTLQPQLIWCQTQTLADQKRSMTETEQPAIYSTSCQTAFVGAVSTQSDFEQHSRSTQPRLDKQTSTSVQTTGDYSPMSTNTESASGRKVLKRKSDSNSAKPSMRKIFVKNYDLINSSVNRGVFEQKIPKFSQITDMEPKCGENMQNNFVTDTSQQQLQLKSNFEWMTVEIFNALQRPCLKFLSHENCSEDCQYNHYLPSAAVVAATIRNWSIERVRYLYHNYVKRFRMCNQLYFDVICTSYVERQSPDGIIETIADCGEMCLEGQFIVVLFALKQCGYTYDQALFEICSHARRSPNALNEILKVIVTFKMVNFKRTIAFLSPTMDTIDFEPYFGNEILKQAAEAESLDVILLHFCGQIVRKHSCILNAHYMASLLSKCEVN